MIRPEDVRQAEEAAAGAFSRAADTERTCFARVLRAFQSQRVALAHFSGSTGYAYGDPGRDVFERTFAAALEAQSALCRPHIASGTHALAVALFGLLSPGDTLVCGSGLPYDTLHEVIGLSGDAPGSLKRLGVSCDVVPLAEGGGIDLAALQRALDKPSARVVALQRSRGYSFRPSLTQEPLRQAIAAVRAARPDALVLVDNCYGEFVEEHEPTYHGADLIAGSLIKNPGGGLAPTGGYVAGRGDLVNRCAARLYAPGVGAEIGSYEPGYRLFFQGLFLAPHTVRQAICSAALGAALFERLGYEVSPGPGELRADIIQAVRLGAPERLIAFCRAVQAASPVDSFAAPEPWAMPGYADEVIMAAGAFVQGASIELSADAPLRPPYIAYLQGGLTYEHGRAALLAAAQAIGPA